MISDGAFSIFKRFSASEKPFHEMPKGRMANLGGGGREKRTFNAFKERSKGLMGSKVQYPEIYCIPETKLLHRARLRSERRNFGTYISIEYSVKRLKFK